MSLAQLLYERVPRSRKALHAVNHLVHPPAFSGWGMTTHHALPWLDANDWEDFRDAMARVRTQGEFEHGSFEDTGITAGNVDTLGWRHWFVSFCVRYACMTERGRPVALVECGVGDGLTSYFACNEAASRGADYLLDCYDAWAPVRVDDGQRDYSSLSLDRTRRNLARYGDRVRFHVGLLPGTLDESAPVGVDYLSIDLNAAAPTVAALEFFMPRLGDRSVILFDDYGFKGYGETKVAVDEFLLGKAGVLLKLPTGQAAWFN